MPCLPPSALIAFLVSHMRLHRLAPSLPLSLLFGHVSTVNSALGKALSAQQLKMYLLSQIVNHFDYENEKSAHIDRRSFVTCMLAFLTGA